MRRELQKTRLALKAIHGPQQLAWRPEQIVMLHRTAAEHAGVHIARAQRQPMAERQHRIVLDDGVLTVNVELI